MVEIALTVLDNAWPGLEAWQAIWVSTTGGQYWFGEPEVPVPIGEYRRVELPLEHQEGSFVFALLDGAEGMVMTYPAEGQMQLGIPEGYRKWLQFIPDETTQTGTMVEEGITPIKTPWLLLGTALAVSIAVVGFVAAHRIPSVKEAYGWPAR